jgi:hypothetical protein
MTIGAEEKNMTKTPVRICGPGYLLVSKQIWQSQAKRRFFLHRNNTFSLFNKNYDTQLGMNRLLKNLVITSGKL